ncbi:hypothetical protein AB0L13_16550 [Saccharopolyspora shandongensis]|uniref:hypothetical protein n=1 Tax=Saccharopolyspora shandongensis TaxID=418495 RepID=UPI00343372B2
MAWRVARCLEVLREQFNDAFPDRSTASDGGIGDAAHASRSSDHNPWHKVGGIGVVTARDFTHDPANGMDIDRLTDELAASRDPRIKYLIANGLILDSRPGNNPWKWMPYTGANPHRKHFHISVVPELCDDDRPWNLPSVNTAPKHATEVDELTPEQDHMLRDIAQQLTGSRNAGEFPGWPSMVDGKTTLTPVDFIRFIDKHVVQLRAELGAMSETVRTLAGAIAGGNDFDADELVSRVAETVRRTIADATVNVDVNVQHGDGGANV